MTGRTGGVFEIDKLDISDVRYPKRLRQIAAPPNVLYYDGRLIESFNEHSQRSVGIVGSRRCSVYGRDMAFGLAEELSSCGVTVISGLAEGIDAAAHRGALKGQGSTIAVLGCGLDFIYPKVNERLYEEIRQTGSLITEYGKGKGPRQSNFPERNRIISGLSNAVVVVEGEGKSGALITADYALDQGKDVMAVPGRVDSPFSRAPHKLLKAGAALVESAQDVLQELGWDKKIKRHHRGKKQQPEALTVEERQVYQAVASESQNIDEIIINTGLHSHQVSSILVILELKNLIIKGLDSKYHVCSYSRKH